VVLLCTFSKFYFFFFYFFLDLPLPIIESETFDLAGSTATAIEQLIRDAFTDPFQLTEMIRLTFITGAGKLGRAKYDDNAARAVTTTLRDFGYEEDRGASAILECAGSYKLQHDTGKNLKTVVVFPKIQTSSTMMNHLQQGMSNVGINGHGTNSTPTVSLIDKDSIEQKLAQTPMTIFTKMIDSKCETWQQKKTCLQTITKLKDMADALDQKLMQGQPLTDPEQDYYNSVSITSLEERMTVVRDLMTKQVDSGNITTDEKKQLLDQITDRLDALSEELQEAETQQKPKRIENLKGQIEKAKLRQTKIQSLSTVIPPKLRNEDAIIKLRKEQAPLLELEKAAKGRLLTLKESQAMARKEEIDDEIKELELSSRQWYETDSMFQARIKVTRTNVEKQIKLLNQAKKKTSAPKASSSMSTASSNATKWVLPGAKKSGAWTKPTSKSTSNGGSGLFAAMMNDNSDSD
jgi:hypothetical protein